MITMLLVANSVVFMDVGRPIVMKPVVVTPEFGSFLLHVLSQASQNVTVKVLS
jgi:hypothetical protein